MAGVMPLIMPAPTMSAGGDAFTGLANNNRAQAAARVAAEAARRKDMIDLAKSWIGQTGNTAKVYGGMQSAGVLERMLGDPSIYGSGATPLTPGMLSGAYTSGADTRRQAAETASIGAANRSGRGGGGDAKAPKMPSGFIAVPSYDENGVQTGEQIYGVDDLDKAAAAYSGTGARVVPPTPGMQYNYLRNGNVETYTVGGGAVATPPVTGSDDITSPNYYDTGDAAAPATSGDIGGNVSVDIGSDGNLDAVRSRFPNSYRDTSGALIVVRPDGTEEIVEE